MANKKIVLVFVHGWSVTNTDTYGGLPERLQNQAGNAGLELEIEDIFLGRYVSFHDEVRVPDISRAFAAAVQDELSDIISKGSRFVCITHSTGGPVVRDWWNRYYLTQPSSGMCPMSHLIMLAPANHGSALAQLGKGRLSRLKFWFGGVEPGQGVLDWLELGSKESWELNIAWIESNGNQISAKGVFPFVLTGESIDRAFYDHLNTYTGENGSDGVVRVAAANLHARYIKLVQQSPQKALNAKKNTIQWNAPNLKLAKMVEAPPSALRIIAAKSHSGKDMGIMRSVKKAISDKNSQETIDAILTCLKVENKSDYNQAITSFGAQTASIQQQQQLEVVDYLLLKDSYFFHDQYSMVVFNVIDQEGHPVKDYDLILTAGKDSDPNHLPRGFCLDKQKNKLNPERITYYFNHDVMKGTAAVLNNKGKEVRPAIVGAARLGLKIIPRPDSGFVHYLPCEVSATADLLEKILQPNSTTYIDICLQRLVYKNVKRLDKGVKTTDFSKLKPEVDLA